MMIKKVQLLIALIIVVLLMACGSSYKQDPVVNDAYKALMKIDAATQVGVNFQQYSQLLIDAKAKVNEAVGKFPDGELKAEFNSTMEAYYDAGQIWSNKIQGMMILMDYEPGKTLIPKYSVRTKKESGGQRLETNPDEAMQIIWKAAKKHLDRVTSLLQ